MKTHGKRSATAVLLLALIFCLLLGNIPALAASETLEVKIPVSCTGADCTAVLLDKDDNELATLALKKGETSFFTATCAGLGVHTLSIKLTDTDTSRITYDKTVFQVNVTLFYGEDGQVHYVIEADPTGVLGGPDSGKPTELTFKNTVKSSPIGPTTISITVNKVWVGEGPHPDSVTVRLLRGATALSTAILRESNGWSHTFSGLSDAYEYSVEEVAVPEGYTATVLWSGRTCTIVNTKDGTTPKPCFDDPPVKKVVEGNPATSETFTFVMTADNAAYPMPEGSKDGVKEITITGTGESEFGILAFTETGHYSYTVVERKGSAEGYTYDEAIYTVSYEITDQDGQLVSARTIKKDGVVVTDFSAFTFTNTYKADDPGKPDDPTKPDNPSKPSNPNTPKTGDDSNLGLWETTAGVSLGLIALLGIALIVTRRKGKEEESNG